MGSLEIKRRTKVEDDADIDRYLIRDPDELRLKKMIWEAMNKDYIEEQNAKKAGNHQAKRKNSKKIAERSAKRSRRGEAEKVVEKRVRSSKVDYHALALTAPEEDERKKEGMDGGGSSEKAEGKDEKAGGVGAEAEDVDACHEDGDEDRINYDDYYTDEGEDHGYHDPEDD